MLISTFFKSRISSQNNSKTTEFEFNANIND